jgi:cell division protein FtsN
MNRIPVASVSVVHPAIGPGPRGCRGNTLVGVVIGFVLGLGVAAVIAFVLTRIPNTFDGRTAKADVANPRLSSIERETAKSGDRPRFDFSKILPGTEDRRAPRDETADRQATPADKPVTVVTAAGMVAVPDSAAAGKYFLQAGAYQNAADAEDQRAKLALMGIEASMQSVDTPEKGTINRIRLGPYTSVDEMNQVKTELLKRGVSTAVIKNP